MRISWTGRIIYRDLKALPFTRVHRIGLVSTSRAKGAKTGPPIRWGGGRKRAVDSVGRFVAEIYGEDRRRSRRRFCIIHCNWGDTFNCVSFYYLVELKYDNNENTITLHRTLFMADNDMTSKSTFDWNIKRSRVCYPFGAEYNYHNFHSIHRSIWVLLCVWNP